MPKDCLLNRKSGEEVRQEKSLLSEDDLETRESVEHANKCIFWFA